MALTTHLKGDSNDQALPSAGTGPTYSVTGGLPDCLSISDDGVLTGTPTESGTFAFTIRATKTWGHADLALTLDVKVAPAITLLQALSIGDVTWPATGDLPAGLRLTARKGAISGTPTTAGTKPFTVTATTDFGVVMSNRSC